MSTVAPDALSKKRKSAMERRFLINRKSQKVIVKQRWPKFLKLLWLLVPILAVLSVFEHLIIGDSYYDGIFIAVLFFAFVPLSIISLRAVSRLLTRKSGGLVFQSGSVKLAGKSYDLKHVTFKRLFQNHYKSGSGTVNGNHVTIHGAGGTYERDHGYVILQYGDGANSTNTMLYYGAPEDKQVNGLVGDDIVQLLNQLVREFR